MSTVIGIMGQSGHGKTTAMRTLPPDETYYVDADRKGLSWRGWRKQYVEGVNYLRSSDAARIMATLRDIDTRKTDIKYIVIDTANGIMLDAEMARIKETGYGKWTELAADVYELITTAGQLRDDLIVVFAFHVASDVNEDGTRLDHILTNGRKLEKIHLESKLPILLYARCLSSPEGNEYVLETQARSSTAKTPLAMFDAVQVPNDMLAVCRVIRAYYDGDDVAPVAAEERKAELAKAPDDHATNAATLIDLQQIDGINNATLSAYCVGKGWLNEGDLCFEHLRPEILAAMVQPDNWLKIRMQLRPELAAVRKLLELSGVTDEQLSEYTEAKAKAEAKKEDSKRAGFASPWWDTAAGVLEKMAETDNWDKVSKKIKGEK